MSLQRRKMLITGSSGFIGRGLAEHFSHSWEVTGVGRKAQGYPERYSSRELPLNAESAQAYFAELNPEVVIHCAGNKDVRWCDANPEEAERVNAHGTKWLAEEAAKIGARFVYISTDLVFPCEKGEYIESDLPGSRLVYGKTKALGEKFTLASSAKALVCRTGGVFGVRSPKITWLQSELAAGRSLEAFTDVVNTPTYLPDLALMLEKILDAGFAGIRHLGGSEAVSRMELFRAFAAVNGFDAGLLKPAKAAPRFRELLLTANSALDSEATYRAIGMRPRSVADAFSAMKLR